MLTLKTNAFKYKNSNGQMEDVGAIIGEKTTDVSLTQSGVAADAKVVGDKFSQLSEQIKNLPTNGTSVSSVEPMNDDIPKVFIDGQIPTSKTEVLAELTYISKTDDFHAYLETKCQGDSSMSYPKKNFTIKMFSDEARETKLKREFRKWGKHNKFVLKANYVDHTHSRNIVSAKLWGQVVASRSDYDSLPDGLKESPNNGAIEGFPIKVYNNGTYQGLYTWNIPKDDWLYGVDEDDPNQFVLYGQKNTDGVYGENANNFRKLWDGVSQSEREWEVEVGTNSDIVKTALNNVISLCINADDVTFKNTLGNYLDVQSALDYYIFVYTICALDSLAQNMILVSYDGTKLYCSAYDLDSTFGLWWNGGSFVSTSYKCPENYQERYSLLWERVEKLFANELKARYDELRKTVLSFSNMVTQFERFIDVIGSDLYAEDLTVYSGIPSGSTNNIKQIRNYIRDRLTYCDGEFAAMKYEPETPDEPDEPDVPEEPEIVDFGVKDIKLGSVTSYYAEEGLRINTGTVPARATVVPVGQYLNKGTKYKISLGDASANYYYGVQVMVASKDGLTFEITSGKQSFDTVVNRLVDTGWLKDDYEYIPTEDNTILAVNFKNNTDSSLTESDRETLLANFVISVIEPDEPDVPEIPEEPTVNLWSDTATYGIDHTTGNVKTNGDAYLSKFVEVPNEAVFVKLYNANGGTYIWKEIHAYDSDKNYLGSNNGKGASQGTTLESTLYMSYYQNMKFVRCTAFPNNVATNNDPNNQLVIEFEISSAPEQPKDVLDGVDFYNGYTYDKNTGVLKEVISEVCTGKFKLENKMYDISANGGSYTAMFVWDENDNFLFTCEVNNTSIGRIQGNENYKYALKVYNSGASDNSVFNVIEKVDTPTEYVTLTFGDLQWETTDNGSKNEIELTALDEWTVLRNTNNIKYINQPSIISTNIMHNNISDYGSHPTMYHIFNHNNHVYLVVHDVFASAEEAKAYFTENGTTITIGI